MPIPWHHIQSPGKFLIRATGSTTDRSLADRHADVVNVKDFGAKGDGSTDDAAAFAAAIAAVPGIDGSWVDFPAGSSAKGSRGSVIIVPPGVYSISTEIELTGSKHFWITAASPRSVRFVNNTGGSYIFKMKAGSRYQGLSGFTLDGGGIELEGSARGMTMLWDLTFQDCPDYAIKAQGASVVYVDVYRCFFRHCRGAVSNLYHDNDGWRVRYGQFSHGRDVPDIISASSGVAIEDGDFEVRKDNANQYAIPYIQITTEASLTSGFPFFTELRRNRFGGEVETGVGGVNTGPPRESIVIGPLSYQDSHAYSVGDRIAAAGSIYTAMTDATSSAEPTFTNESTDGGVTWSYQYLPGAPNGTYKGAWAQGMTIVPGDFVSNGGHVYTAYGSGTTGASAPVHHSGSASDGGVTWGFYGQTYIGDWSSGAGVTTGDYASVANRLYHASSTGTTGVTTPTWTNVQTVGGIQWRREGALGVASTLVIEGNYFLGTQGTYSTTEANSAIRFNMAPLRVKLRENHFRRAYSYLIHEAYFDAQGASDARDNEWASDWADARDNEFGSSNTWESLHTAAIFSHGGVGWRGIKGSDLRRPSRNMLRATESVDSSGQWTKVNVTMAKDATGPDGVASSAWTVTRTGTSSQIQCSTLAATFASATEGATASVWVKRGGASPINVVRLGLYASAPTSKWIASPYRAFTLTDEWQRIEVWAPWTPASGAATFTLYADSVENATLTTGTFLFARPQVEPGLGATPYTSSAATSREARPFGALVLGDMVVGYGAAAPASGQHEVGEVWINTAPAAGGKIGWVCTVAGAPGTWKAFGAIDP